MPQPLTELENQIVLKLLARFKSAARIMNGDRDNWNSPVPLNPTLIHPLEVDHICGPLDLAHAGAHHLSISLFGESLLQDKEPGSSLSIAISALLWEEPALAEEWAMRSLEKLKIEIRSQIELPYWREQECEILKLAKVFRALERSEEEHLLRKRLNEILADLHTGRDAGMDALRLAIELGYEQEAEALALKLPPLLVGHSRGNLTRRLFQTLLSHDKQILVWALFAMTSEQHDEDGLRHDAMEVACERGNFILALKFGSNDGYEKERVWPHLVSIAKWLIAKKRTNEWREIWKLVTEVEFGLYHRFSMEHRLIFLSVLIEHVPQTDRVEMYKISNKYYQGLPTMPNRELAQEITNIHLIIAAWGASKATVRRLVKTAKIPKHHVPTMLRAAAERSLPCLLVLVPEAQSQLLIQDPITALRVEWEKMQRGKRHRLEKVLKDSIAKALVTNDRFMIYNIIQFVGGTWKDLDLYRELLTRYPSEMGLNIVDIWPFILPFVDEGNLIALDLELSKVTDAHCLSEAYREFYRCLAIRFGIKDRLEDF